MSFTYLGFLDIRLSLDPSFFPIYLTLMYMFISISKFYQTYFFIFQVVIPRDWEIHISRTNIFDSKIYYYYYFKTILLSFLCWLSRIKPLRFFNPMSTYDNKFLNKYLQVENILLLSLLLLLSDNSIINFKL